MKQQCNPAFLSALIAFGILLSGCASKPEIVVDPTLNEENAGKIFIYRPSSDWMGMAIDFRVMLDDRYVGSLKTGGDVQSFAAPGDHEIKVQPHFLSVPDRKPSTMTIQIEAAQGYYIRFSQHLDGAIIVPGMGLPLGHSELNLVTFEAWEQRF